MKPACQNCFKTLAVTSRFKIFEYLKKRKNVNVSKLVKFLALRQPTVTFHLARLEAVGLITKKSIGREVFCQIGQPCQNCPLFNWSD